MKLVIMTGILEELKWETLQERREDNRLILLYKGLKGKARIPTDDLIPKNRHCRNRVVSGLPGAKVRRGTKRSSDPSQMYNITTIGLPTTIHVYLNRYLGVWGLAPINNCISNLLRPVNQRCAQKSTLIGLSDSHC